jgi:sporulation protein YlmC with PRC-barrel domain
MTRTNLYAVLLVSALASPALAQDAPTNSATPGEQFVAKAAQGEWRASKLAGVSIYGSNKESIGKVNDVIVDKTGAAKFVVIGAGGVLGIGAKTVAVPFNTVEWSDQPLAAAPAVPPPTGATTGGAQPATSMTAEAPSSPSIRDYPDHGMVKLTMDQIKSAPDFHYASEKLASGQ